MEMTTLIRVLLRVLIFINKSLLSAKLWMSYASTRSFGKEERIKRTQEFSLSSLNYFLLIKEKCRKSSLCYVMQI